MSDDTQSSVTLSAACRFFQYEIFNDPFMTEHDMQLLEKHAKSCDICTAAIGEAVNAMSMREDKTPGA